MIFTRGMRDKIAKYVDPASKIIVTMSINGKSVYDFCSFGVDKSEMLSDERYMIFYNQTSSPKGEIKYHASNNSASFTICLASLPESIDKLVFTASIDGSGIMGDIVQHKLSISQNGTEKISIDLKGSDFKQEKAVISVEIYRKGDWRINAIASGFNGGLPVLLRKYGGEEDVSSAPQQIPAPQVRTNTQSNLTNQVPSTHQGVVLRKNEEELTQELMGKISLSKDKVNLEKHVVNFSKSVVNLSKKSGVDLGSTRAKVVVVLDYSGSMYHLYSNGTVQRTINRLVPLGLTFDDNGTIDVFLFSNSYEKLDDLNLLNYEHYVNTVVRKSSMSMGGTCYAPLLRAIIEGDTKQIGFLSRKTEYTPPIVDNGDPTFLLFITDGENADHNATDVIIKKASSMNVFIQFIGIGNEQFNYLQKLDDLPGRMRDNTGFSKMQSLDSASDQELYTNVLEQFSNWLKGFQ